MIESHHNHTSEPDILTSIILKVIGVYSILFVLLLNIFILDNGKLKKLYEEGYISKTRYKSLMRDLKNQ